MADPFALLPLAYPGVHCELKEELSVATLRYFGRNGDFAQRVQAASGVPLPGTGRALSCANGELTFAWSRPTETLCLAENPAALARLAAALSGVSGGCCIELTGGLKVLRLSGERVADLLCRLGGTASVPLPGHACRSRMADVAVVALSLREGETQLLIDRPYLPHLLGWIRETLLDFAAG